MDPQTSLLLLAAGVAGGVINALAGGATLITFPAMLAAGLPRVKADPKDISARMDCQIGTWLSTGPLASGVPMGASHAIGHVLGGTCDVPHYFCTAVMMPSVLRYNPPATEKAQQAIAAALGAPGRDAGEQDQPVPQPPQRGPDRP